MLGKILLFVTLMASGLAIACGIFDDRQAARVEAKPEPRPRVADQLSTRPSYRHQRPAVSFPRLSSLVQTARPHVFSGFELDRFQPPLREMQGSDPPFIQIC